MNRPSDMIEMRIERSPPEEIEIAIANEQSHLPVEPDWLKQIIQSVLCDEGWEAAQISLALVDDAAIHVVNRKFLGHDSPTDVISFSLQETAASDSDSEPSRGEAIQSLDGEIIISTETALRRANEYEFPPSDELALYLVHGLLHLCGYDDQTAAQRQRMREREKSHLKKFGIPANYED